MKPCPHCGKELPEEMQFCPFCMEKLIPENPVSGTPAPKNRLFRWIGIAATLCLIGVALWLWPQGETANTPTGANAPSTTTGTTSGNVDTTTRTGDSPSATRSTATTPPKTSTTKKITNTTASVAPCAGGHAWTALTETVHHEEVGHYEQQTTGSTRVTVYSCAICYQKHTSLKEYYAHFDTQHKDTAPNINVFRERYETDTEIQPLYEQVWVVDQEAYDETVTVGRRCQQCGKTEDNP